MSNLLNLSKAKREAKYPLIVDGTIAKVRLDIQAGGFNNEGRGWTGGWASQGKTGAVYLKCEFKILSGKHQGQKIWSLIGLHSPKNEIYESINRAFIKEILESARGVNPNDTDEASNNKRSIKSFADLDNLTFVAEISIGKDQRGDAKNEIKKAITSDHPEYLTIMKGDLQEQAMPF